MKSLPLPPGRNPHENPLVESCPIAYLLTLDCGRIYWFVILTLIVIRSNPNSDPTPDLILALPSSQSIKTTYTTAPNFSSQNVMRGYVIRGDSVLGDFGWGILTEEIFAGLIMSGHNNTSSHGWILIQWYHGGRVRQSLIEVVRQSSFAIHMYSTIGRTVRGVQSSASCIVAVEASLSRAF